MPSRKVIVSSLAVLYVLAGLAGRARAAEPVDLSGKWKGDWVSCTTGHHGTLCARFHKISDTCYRVHFSGTFFTVVPFYFSVNLTAGDQGDGTVVLSGAPHLPLFGTFQFAAVASACDFHATYETQRDAGRFTLHRGGRR
jgi:hypothetical protein